MFKLIKKFIIFILLIIISITAIFTYLGYNLYLEAITETSISDKVKSIQSSENYVKHDDISEMFLNSVVSVEDRRFYDRGAIDIISIGRAIVTNIKTFSLSEGGSTITQQVAKNIYFTQKKQLTRKVAEIFVAFDLEKECSKDEILELYVNTCYYGSGFYGIKEAANGFYEKEPANLTPYESTLLAGVPNAPSVYSPKVNLNLAEERQTKVISTLVENNYITQNEANEILKMQKTK